MAGPRLERLQRAVSIVDGSGLPTVQFQLFWQRTAEAIEGALASITDVNATQQELLDRIAEVLGITETLNEAVNATQQELLDRIAEVLGITETLNEAVVAAQSAADAANAAAGNAQGAADTAEKNSSLATSGTTGLSISAADAGANVTASISAHSRIYGDGATVAVSAGTITGLAYSTTYYLYYSDPARTGGTVTFQATTNQADAAQIGDVHSLGAVATPAAAAPPSTGRPNLPPGVNEP